MQAVRLERLAFGVMALTAAVVVYLVFGWRPH
jgi:hypothetical protein